MLRLLVEPPLLLRRIVDLGVGVPELHSTGEVLEPLDERVVVVHRPCERRELDGMAVHHRRLDEGRFDEVGERVVDELRPIPVGLGIDTALLQPGAQLVRVASPELVLLERLDEREPAPRALQVELVLPEGDRRRSQDLARDLLEHRLDAHHRVLVVRVGLVPLEHRELGLVLVGDALVPEVLPDLVHALEPADNQALEIELGRDAQEEVGLELVGVRDERMREGAAVAWLQHRRLDLDEALSSR